MDGVSTTRETTCGAVRGSRTGDVVSWKGIPFAAPPVGPLRFAPPEPAVPWEGVRDGSRYGAASLQHPGFPTPLVQDVVQSEDCLNLNVWAPATAEPRGRAVLVWIHGGAYLGGSGAEYWSDGTNLAGQEDIVVVSVNYRLGALGGLALDEAGTLGNNFLLDVVQALRWVRDNIAAFGGDPDRVTIGGQSAGAMIVAALVASPYAHGLFHAAIVQSGHGTGNAPRASAHRARDLVVSELGIARDDHMMERLLAADVADLIRAQQKAAEEMITPFKPVTDGDILPLPVIGLFAAATQQSVPLLLGTTRDEHNLFAAMGWGHGTGQVTPLRERLEQVLIDPEPAVVEELIAVYQELARSDGLDWNPDDAAWNILRTDLDWRGPQRDLAAFHADIGAPVYRYEFAFRTPVDGGVLGAAHALDIPFVFGNLDQPGMAARTGDDVASPARRKVAAQCTQAWGSFVRDGRPESQHLPQWPRYERDRQEIMVLGSEPMVVTDPHVQRLDVWKKLATIPPLSS
ncbi:carboxylesterase/lipase family protein [Streptomyces sp. NPDC096311]|uniref:carboxylesterase/lipase family protein n=1 Tax=Streptomyces sp. NPDC096311 TaxID=3366083 RepID=UPI0038128BF8